MDLWFLEESALACQMDAEHNQKKYLPHLAAKQDEQA
jgi:hypothetical protein